jgi:FKBP-type peptidyl-prolyl cis-trans isomerase FkpA
MQPPVKPHSFQLLATGISLFAVLATSSTLCAAESTAMTEEQKTLYAIGISVARSLSVFDLTQPEFDYVKQGLVDAHSGKKSDVELTLYSSRIQDLARTRRNISGGKQAGAGKDFLEKAAKEKGAIKTDSGMVYTPVTEGKGESPKAADIVKVNYRGTLIDGREFDSSYKRGKPLEFKLDNVIKCWTEGVQRMKPGGKAKLVCPAQLAYGENGTGDLILPGATLLFEVELLEFKKEAAARPVSPKPVQPADPGKK